MAHTKKIKVVSMVHKALKVNYGTFVSIRTRLYTMVSLTQLVKLRNWAVWDLWCCMDCLAFVLNLHLEVWIIKLYLEPWFLIFYVLLWFVTFRIIIFSIECPHISTSYTIVYHGKYHIYTSEDGGKHCSYEVFPAFLVTCSVILQVQPSHVIWRCINIFFYL